MHDQMPNHNYTFSSLPTQAMTSSIKPLLLFIDDDPIALDLIVKEFRSRLGDGLQYEKAQSAAEAHELIAEEIRDNGRLPAMVICDYMMPEKMGDQFLIELHEQYPQIPLVLHSGLADASTVNYIKQNCKLLASLPKPWDGVSQLDTIQDGLRVTRTA